MLELASILVLGIFAQWLAFRIKQPAILPLILIGLLVGPLSTFITPDGEKLIDGDAIFTGDLLFSFVSLSVGVILFEGGLTLHFKELKNQGGTIRNLLIAGMATTFILGGLAAHFIMGMEYRLAFLFGALLIVSGPTVVTPILRNVKPNAKINTLLKWEGILIDPFGAMVAVLVYEVINSSTHHRETFTLETLQEFFITISAGVVAGICSAGLLWYLFKKRRIPRYLSNVFTLGLVILTFAFAELIHTEAGLLAATVMGIALGNSKIDEVKSILAFKEDISIILISVLFLLLSSRIEIAHIESIGWHSLLLFATAIFLIRPIGVLIGTIGSNLNWREKLFISWIGPKGIVAAAVASLFSLQLTKNAEILNIPKEQAELLLPITFLMIVGTVVLQGSTAKWVGRRLKVLSKVPNGILFIGAGEVSRLIAKKLQDQGYYILLADTSPLHIANAKSMNLRTYHGNVLSDHIFEELDVSQFGQLIAFTSNSGINESACRWFQKELGDDRVFRLASSLEVENKNLPLPNNVLFGSRTDYVAFTQSI
ncbi:MAG: cation:proton antiporter, partial [Bacteroidetes bacterium]|nr:cation:proton antiporter [Bacteroidota bacterium]